VCAPCHRPERYAAAIILNMHKDNAAATQRVHSVAGDSTNYLISTTRARCVGAPRALCEDAV